MLVDTAALGVDEIYFEAGIATDGHGHELSQAAYQVAGKFEINLAGGVVTLGPGDSYAIPSGVEHSVRCIEKGSYILITARGAAASAGSHDDDHAHGSGGHAHDDHAH